MSDTTPVVTVVGNVRIDTQVYLPGQDIRFDVESNFTETLIRSVRPEGMPVAVLPVWDTEPPL